MHTRLTELLQIEYPILMAPMFLVSSKTMVEKAMHCGIIGAFPSLNYRKDKDLEQDLKELNTQLRTQKGTYAVNLIIKGNSKYQAHLDILIKYKVPLVITSLGNPTEVIEKVHAYGGKVFCDVTHLYFAQKASLADGFIAVGDEAGGHLGRISLKQLIPELRQNFPNKIILGAGGITNKKDLEQLIQWGADGASAGTVFIASDEANASKDYKNAIVKASAKDIITTKILSGADVTVIQTDYLNQLTTEIQTKDLSGLSGIEMLKKAGVNVDYKALFIAGKSVEKINKIQSIETIIRNFKI